jgi:inward rectifier potassium channel
MRSRWFHVPQLHTALHHEKKVTWLELFYDLIFVAAIIQLGDALSDGVTRDEGVLAAAKFAGHFVPLWIAWTGFTFYANRFTVDDFLHRGLAFAQMFAIGAMAIAAPAAMAADPQPRNFALAFSVAQAVIAIMYLRSLKQVPEAADYSRYWGGVFALGSVVWVVAAFLPSPWCYAVWGLGVSTILFSPLNRVSRALTERFPLDMEHLSERYGLLTIIVLGESFVKVLSYLSSHEHGTDPTYLLKGFFNLLITCTVWWIYFDDVAGAKLKKGRGSWIIWVYGHMPLAIGCTAVGVAVKKAIKFDLNDVPDAKYGWLLAASLALTFLSVAIIDSVSERKVSELSDRTRVNVRVASAFLLLLMGQIGSTMQSGMFLGVIATICVAQVLFDMVMAPLEEGHVASTSIKEIAENKDAPESRKPKIRRDLSEAVRRGAPSELRSDLYFWLMQGSWTRMILLLCFIYMAINVAFAGLYLLDPACIGASGPTAFLTAFSFSVQTMSTIGYGTISPLTPYGDLIVTIEAAAGLLAVALATGLMFAKASQPRSSVLFSDTCVLTQRHGVPTLMFRVGNARGNEVIEANMSVTALKDELSPEGHHMRRLHSMDLVRSQTPVFTLSWMVMHEIDEDSPLANVDWDKPEDSIMAIIVTMTGHDATYGSTTHARHMYDPAHVTRGERFVDVISELEDGRLMIDFGDFHKTEPDA